MNDAKNFYEAEAGYEESVVETKKMVEQIIKIDEDDLNKKIIKVDDDNEFEDYIGLLRG